MDLTEIEARKVCSGLKPGMSVSDKDLAFSAVHGHKRFRITTSHPTLTFVKEEKVQIFLEELFGSSL